MFKLTATKPEDAALITHSGTFHADEVFSTVIMSILLKLRDKDAKLTFARVNRVTDDMTGFVYDVGYGPYDHHQRGGNGSRGNGVPYAACGLIWRDFGKEICQSVEGCDVDKVWRTIDTMLIQGIDASDCGMLPALDYPAHPMSVNAVIAQCNPKWDDDNSEDAQYQAFFKACDLAYEIFNNTFANVVSTARAYAEVYTAIENSVCRVAVLDKFMPWIEAVFEAGNKTGVLAEKARKLMYVVYPALRGGYQWRAVPISPSSFAQRNECPPEWRGLSGDELRNVSGISTATFVHANGFIGGAETKDDGIRMAIRSTYREDFSLKLLRENPEEVETALENARFGACAGDVK